MNKLGFLVVACLSLLVLLLAQRLHEAERKLALLEARPHPARVRPVPDTTEVAALEVAGETYGVLAADTLVEPTEVPVVQSGKVAKECEPVLSDRSPRREMAARHEALSGFESAGLSTGFLLAEPSQIVEHWTGGEKRRWGHEQAAGEPDTAQPGDIPSAWASKAPDGGEEWIQLDYDRAVDLQQVNVVESHNPGAIRKLVAILPDGTEAPVWEGTMDPSAGDELVASEFKVGDAIRAQSVKVYLDTARVPGWNEIDAVQIIGRDGSKQWASASSASSSYADP